MMNQEKNRKSVLIWEGSQRSEGERSEPERSEELSQMAGPNPAPAKEKSRVPDAEVLEKASRRRFSAEYKLGILAEAEQCEAGQLGALLRREGLYWSHLQTWRRQRDAGALEALTPQKRGRKATPKHPLAGRVKQLEGENRRLHRKLQRAEIMLDIQKKASELLGIPLAKLDSEKEEDQ